MTCIIECSILIHGSKNVFRLNTGEKNIIISILNNTNKEICNLLILMKPKLTKIVAVIVHWSLFLKQTKIKM